MTYEIDQSGKIEDTSKLTVVAVANGRVKTLVISSREKRKLIQAMRVLNPPKTNYIYRIFAALIFLLISEINRDQMIFIDREYPGHESVIKDTLIWLYQKTNHHPPQIGFKLIGKCSPAHHLAIAIFRDKQKPDLTVSATQVLRLFYTLKIGRRSQSSRDNP